MFRIPQTKLFLVAALLLFFSSPAFCQKQTVTLEDLYQNYTFRPAYVGAFDFLQDGKSFMRMDEAEDTGDTEINRYDFASGKFIETMMSTAMLKAANPAFGKAALEGLTFSEDERKAVIQTEVEQIYRWSSRCKAWVWDSEKRSLQTIAGGKKVMYPTLNTTADKIAYVLDNNLYVEDLATGKATALSKDGRKNHIINGASDWVYEEEFELVRAFEWSPDGQSIAWFQFEESKVPEFKMESYTNAMYPGEIAFKYPKAGERNANVKVFWADLKKAKAVEWLIPDNSEEVYLPRMYWSPDGKLFVMKMNRHQSELQFFFRSPKDKYFTLGYTEKSDTYLEVNLRLKFLEGGKKMLFTSEEDGFNHLYTYDFINNKRQQITRGQWEVTEVYGLDEKNNIIYYQSTEKSPLERHLYKINLDGSAKQCLQEAPGTHYAQFSKDFSGYFHTFSSSSNPPTYTVRSGGQERVLEDNADYKKVLADYDIPQKEFFQFQTSEGITLNGWMIKPSNFDASRRYPVLFNIYGGPGHQTVTNAWDGGFWNALMASKGIIVVSVDNRGTGGRGAAFKKSTYLKLGELECKDQIEAAKYLGKLPYVDAKRIGIFGWSFGGYLSSLCILKGADVFKTAVAVAPVTNWKWYDSIYTERFLRTPKENSKGYEENSPINFAELLKGDYLIVHGMADDNVHFQHTVEMINALVKHNKQFESLVYPNRNHGIYGGKTRLHLFTKITDFVSNSLGVQP